ncbi:MAG TPA: glycosyltransferase, partial [Streptosporangiaceae bacterium]|nr:glycosyltransferase [Streptosporangiaceae bacterium]
MKLSILMPAYNEAATVGVAVKRVLDIHYPCDVEVVIVNDGSVDNTSEVLATIDDPRVVISGHPVNRGKGAAVRTAAALATGDYLLVFDADLEYSADDILGLLAPVSR